MLELAAWPFRRAPLRFDLRLLLCEFKIRKLNTLLKIQ